MRHTGVHSPWPQRARHALAHSLRVRMVALFLLLALCLVGVFVVGMQAALSVGWRDVGRPVLTDYVDRLAAELGSPPSVPQAQALVQRLPLSVRIRGPVVNWESEPRRHSTDGDARWRDDEPRFLERVTADGHHVEFGISLSAWSERPRSIGWLTLALLLALVAVAYLRVRRMLRPLDDIRAGALRFGQGDFAQPIAVRLQRHPDELSELAGTINTMASDISGMLDAKRALLLAISHELRSPLTRARLHAELLPESTELAPQRDALLRDLALMRDLVNDLLESERLAGRHAVLQRERVDMARLVREQVDALAAEGATVQLELAQDIPPCLLDPARVRLLVRNLLENAWRYGANAHQAPIVGLRAGASGGVCLRVRDFGPGVDASQIDQLGQAFFRPDAARERATGGVGLGLYLCKLVVQAHGGTMRLANASPGLEITVNLP